MTLRETLETMKEKNSEQNFSIMIEGMRRRADKGMIPGVSSKDIDECLREMLEAESNPQSLTEKEELIGIIADLDNAIQKYGYLAEEYEISDEEMNIVGLNEFYIKMTETINESLADKMDEFKQKRHDWAEENPYSHGKAMAGVGAAAGAVGGGVLAADAARRSAERAAYIKQFANSGKTAAELAKEYNASNPSLMAKAGSGIIKGAKAVGGFMKANPILGAGMAGVGLAAAGFGLAAAIKRARRRRQAALREDEEIVNIFEEKTILEVKEIIDSLPTDLVEAIIFESNELVQELMIEALNYGKSIQETETLTEAVTYIDNNGALKTKSAKEYVEDMHKYDTSTTMEKFDLKKRKNHKYSLLDENLDVNNIKMLSEMTLEEIFSEVE